MKSLRSSAELAAALREPMDPELKHLLRQRREEWLEDQDVDLADLVHIIVVERGDTLPEVEAEAGAALDGFEFIERHGSVLEAVLILSQDGFGVALFVPDPDEADPDLLALLHA